MPVPDSVKAALSAHLGRFPAQQVTLPWQETGGSPVTVALVLTSPTGLAVNRNTFNTYAWKPALEAAGVAPARENGCHALRHHFASLALHGGVDIKALSEYLGHHSAAFTLATYVHLMPSAHDRMREAIDAAREQDHGPATAQTVCDDRLCRQNAVHH